MKTAQEILDKHCNYYGGFLNVINNMGGSSVNMIIINSMEEYAAQFKKKPKKELTATPEIIEVVDYLNLVVRGRFSPNTKETIRLVGARLKTNTVGDCKLVIDIKAAQWLKDEKMSRYLCPSTLFAESNFEKYLNEAPKGNVEKKSLGFEIKVDNKEYNDYVCSQKLKGENWVGYKEWLLNK